MRCSRTWNWAGEGLIKTEKDYKETAWLGGLPIYQGLFSFLNMDFEGNVIHKIRQRDRNGAALL
jgi:hypothetical protein